MEEKMKNLFEYLKEIYELKVEKIKNDIVDTMYITDIICMKQM